MYIYARRFSEKLPSVSKYEILFLLIPINKALYDHL